MNDNEQRIKKASNAGLLSLLNLTILPGIGFLLLIRLYQQSTAEGIDHYYSVLGIKLNLTAAAALLFVSGLMIALGGFTSPWTWVYVISYFTLVHTFFIMLATWYLVRSWTGERLHRRFF